MDAKLEYLELIRSTVHLLENDIKYLGKYAVMDVAKLPQNLVPQATKQKQLKTPQTPQAETASSEIPPQYTLNLEEKQQQISNLAMQAKTCTKCKLATTRTQVVFGQGSMQAKFAIVGEAPGYYEDQQGLAFVGPAGQLLTKMLLSIGLQRDDVYICNVVKCRPPQNRNPEPNEVLACKYWLTQQLNIIKPKLLCAMGKFASSALSGINQAMWMYREKIYHYQDIPTICTYHPAYLLRNPEQKKKAWQDLLKLKSML